MKSESDIIYDKLQNVFAKNATKEDAVKMTAYMKGHFEYYGVKSVLRKELMASVITNREKPKKSEGYKLANLLWSDKHRELQYVAMEILAWYKKETEEKDIQLMEELLTTKSWWDTVDFVAAHLVGNYFSLHPNKRDSICKKWSNSNNMWLQRSVILSQLKYKDKTDSEFLFHYCKKHKEDKEFFIRKAIGWALREYSKTNPKAVECFVKNTNLSNLSVKEATKYL